MEDRLNSRRLHYFMQVVESGSIRGAADALGMDPSAVSRALGLLERDCGIPLLERRGRGVVPTDAGELLAGYIRRQNSQQLRLLAQFDSIQKLERGHIDIVAGEGFVDWLMRHSLRTFMLDHPGITVDLAIGNTDEIVQRIVEEDAHIGLVFQPPKDERLRSHCAYPQPIQALVHDSHPLTRLGRPLRLSDLVPYSGAMLHAGFGLRQHISAAEISEGVRLHSALTTSSINAVAQFVLAGLGYALSTRFPLQVDEPHMVALPMENPLLSQGEIKVVSRHGRMLSPAVTKLLHTIVADMGRNPGRS